MNLSQNMLNSDERTACSLAEPYGRASVNGLGPWDEKATW